MKKLIPALLLFLAACGGEGESGPPAGDGSQPEARKPVDPNPQPDPQPDPDPDPDPQPDPVPDPQPDPDPVARKTPKEIEKDLKGILVRAGEYMRVEEFDKAEGPYLEFVEKFEAQPEEVVKEFNPFAVESWRNVPQYQLACIYATRPKRQGLSGAEKEKWFARALEYLERAFEAGYKDWYHIKRDKDMDPLREDARYKSLVEKYKNKR